MIFNFNMVSNHHKILKIRYLRGLKIPPPAKKYLKPTHMFLGKCMNTDTLCIIHI